MTEAPHTRSAAPAADTGRIPQMRGRHALAGAEPPTRDPELFRALTYDLRVRRVEWMLTLGLSFPWLLKDVTDPDAVDRAVQRGLVAPPVSHPNEVLLPYHLTDAGHADLLSWAALIAPHLNNPDIAAIWRAVTLK